MIQKKVFFKLNLINDELIVKSLVKIGKNAGNKSKNREQTSSLDQSCIAVSIQRYKKLIKLN